MESQNKQTAPVGNGTPKDYETIVKRLFTSLILTVKNLSLYPPGHTISTKSINQFYSQLTAFLNKYGTFRLDIERERVLCQGETVYEGVSEEGTLHYTFFRDGLRWIEFRDGIQQAELIDIFTLVNKYTKLSAEPEGDIVTAFWEVRFPHMKYEVAELLWGGDLEKEKYSDLESGKSSLTQDKEPDKREKEYQGDPPIDMQKVMLSPEEEAELQLMIRTEDDTDLTSYVDALLDSLLQNKEEIYFSKFLDAFTEEFTFSLTRMDFDITLKILQGLKYVQDICREELPWTEKLIEDFFLNVSSAVSLAPLKNIWKQLDPDDAVILKEIFLLLNPKAIQVLLSLPPESQPVPQRKVLLDLIILLASRDTGALDMALGNASENLLERLFSIIVRLEREHSLKYLLRLSHHTSGRIRYEAIKEILRLEPSRIKDMLNMVDDKEDSIRQFVLEQMGQTRDRAIEEFLISYITRNKSGDIDGNHILQCFRILGRCGSSHSVPMLRELLLKWGFLSGARRTILRRGAAIALGMLRITEAEKVLDRAGRSLFPGVRGPVTKVRQELSEEAGTNVQ